MIIYCPNCGQKCELDDEYDGAAVECPQCEKEFIARKPIPLIVCPACQEKVSSMAEACPHCGQPIAPPAPKPEPQPVVIQQASSHYPILQVSNGNMIYMGIAVLGFIAVYLLWGAGCEKMSDAANALGGSQQDEIQNTASFLYFLGMITLIIPMVCCYLYSRRSIHCERCGYSGVQTSKGGVSIVLFLFLTCLAVLPGIIYLLVCSLSHKKFKCPNCGLEREA